MYSVSLYLKLPINVGEELKKVICTDDGWKMTTRLLNYVAEPQQMPQWQLPVTRKNVLTCVSSQHQWFLYTPPDVAVQFLIPSHLLSQLFHTLQHCVESKNVIGKCCFSKNLMKSALKSWLANLEMGLYNYLCSLFKKTESDKMWIKDSLWSEATQYVMTR